MPEAQRAARLPVGQTEKCTGFAIIGCGSAGKRRSAALGPGEVRVACDLDLAEAKAAARGHDGCRITASQEEAILDSNVQAVIVSTPHAALAKLALMAVRAGKHVLIEKPGAIRSDELREVQDAAKQSGSLVRIGFNHRYSPAFQKAYELVKTEGLGSPLFIRAKYGHGGRAGFNKEWRVQPNVSGGGVLIDMGIHLIDLAASFMGDFATIQGQVSNFFWDIPVEDNAFLDLRTTDNRTAWLHSSYTDWKNVFSFEIGFRNTKLDIEGIGRNYGFRRLYYHRSPPEWGPPKTTIFDFPGDDPSWKAETADFREDILQQRIPIPGLKEGIRALEIVERIYLKKRPYRAATRAPLYARNRAIAR
jgi:predicted dehydrogenase